MGVRGAFWAALGGQLRKPSGLTGQLAGRLMSLANSRSNKIAIEALAVRPSETVLELGVGPGCAVATLSTLAPYGQVVGLDHSSVMLAQTAHRNSHAIRNGRVHLVQGCFDALPFKSGTVDKLLAVHVAYFMSPDTTELREAARVLRPGGRLALLATDRAAMARWKFPEYSGHRLFTRNQLIQDLQSAGFAPANFSVSRIKLSFDLPGLLAVVTKPGAQTAF